MDQKERKPRNLRSCLDQWLRGRERKAVSSENERGEQIVYDLKTG